MASAARPAALAGRGEVVAAGERLGMVRPEPLLLEPEVLLERRDGLGGAAGLEIGHAEVVAGIERVGMVEPDDPRQAIAGRPGHLEDLGIEPAAMPEDVRELAEGHERLGVLGPSAKASRLEHRPPLPLRLLPRSQSVIGLRDRPPDRTLDLGTAHEAVAYLLRRAVQDLQQGDAVLGGVGDRLGLGQQVLGEEMVDRAGLAGLDPGRFLGGLGAAAGLRLGLAGIDGRVARRGGRPPRPGGRGRPARC